MPSIVKAEHTENITSQVAALVFVLALAAFPSPVIKDFFCLFDKIQLYSL